MDSIHIEEIIRQIQRMKANIYTINKRYLDAEKRCKYLEDALRASQQKNQELSIEVQNAKNTPTDVIEQQTQKIIELETQAQKYKQAIKNSESQLQEAKSLLEEIERME